MSCDCQSLAQQLARIDSKVTGLLSKIGALEDENTRLKNQIDQNARRITNQANRITRLSRRVDELEGLIDTKISDFRRSFVDDLNRRDSLLRGLIYGLIKGLEAIIQGVGYLARQAWNLIQQVPGQLARLRDYIADQIANTNRTIEDVVRERERREREIMDRVARQIDRVLREIRNRQQCPGPQIVRVREPFPVPQPYPVRVPVPQPVDRPYPVRVPVPQPVDRPYPVRVPVPQPVDRPYPVRVPVPQPVDRPYPVRVPVPQQVDRPVPYPVRVPVPQPVDRPVVVTNTNTIERVRTVNVPTPYPVTNTITRIEPRIVTVTPPCPDPCPPCNDSGGGDCEPINYELIRRIVDQEIRPTELNTKALYENHFKLLSLDTLNLAFNVHNAQRLSFNAIPDVSNALAQIKNAIPIQFVTNTGTGVNFSTLVSSHLPSNLNSLVPLYMGNRLDEGWIESNNLFSSVTNLLQFLQRLGDELQNTTEITADRLAILMNRIREQGLVSDNSWDYQPRVVTDSPYGRDSSFLSIVNSETEGPITDPTVPGLIDSGLGYVAKVPLDLEQETAIIAANRGEIAASADTSQEAYAQIELEQRAESQAPAIDEIDLVKDEG